MKKIHILGGGPISNVLKLIFKPYIIECIDEATAVIFVIDSVSFRLSDMYEMVNTKKVNTQKLLCTGAQKPETLRDDITWVKPDLINLCKALEEI